MLSFHVSDTGAGIAEDKIDKIFERFVKANNVAQGTGLGLSISKVIIEKLGGTIAVSSIENKGTTFTFTLPLANEQPKEVEIIINTPQPNEVQSQANNTNPQNNNTMKTILVAEDTDSNYILAKAILGKIYNLKRAKDGMEAVNMFEEINPDLILMDMKMPNLDGLDATRIIRQLSKDVPIIALTAYAFEHDKQAALEAGCNDFLTKPYTQEMIKGMIKKYIR
jgi:CheY-like chemotaxis protein